MLFLPGELVEFLFGSSNNFDNLWTILLISGFILTLLGIKPASKKLHKSRVNKKGAQKATYDKERKPSRETEEPPIKESYFGQYERYDDLNDEEMRLAMQFRVKSDMPSFEEWKKAKEQERRANEEQNIASENRRAK